MSKISREAAEEQLDLFFDYYEIGPEDLEPAQLEGFLTARKRLTKAIQNGRLSIEDGEPLKITQYLKKPKGDVSTLEYSEMGGHAKIAMKGRDETDTYGRIYAVVGSLTGVGEKAIAGLKGVDMSIAECLGILFLLI